MAQSLDPARGDNRSSSAEAYLTPVEDSRENWTVLVEHMVRLPVDIYDSTTPNLAPRSPRSSFRPWGVKMIH